MDTLDPMRRLWEAKAMAERRTIIVLPDSEVARLLDEAADGPLTLEKDGVRYRLGREDADGFIAPPEFYSGVASRADVQEILARLAR